ncbi:MAG TPA: glycosyltransferase family 4 protein [Solirubrobacteraceae bacterium]
MIQASALGQEADNLQSPGATQREVRVLALIDHLVLGGAEMLLGQFAAAAPSARISLEVACLEELDGNPAAAALRGAGIEPTNLELPGRPSLSKLLAVRRHIAARRPDIVHTHLGDADLHGCAAARSLGIPAVSTIHTVEWSTDLKTRVARTVVKGTAARVIAVSDTARAVYAGQGWARPGQLVVIHNGVDVEPVPGAGREIRAELGWGRDDLVVGMLSALRRIKAHDVAIEAVAKLGARYPSLRLLIVGGGPARDEIEQCATRLGDSVAMVGRQNDVMRYFDAFDVCLHPSRAEAFPTTLIEAMAASVPVVATAVGGIPEIVDDGATGLLVEGPPAADAISGALAALLEDPARRGTMGARGRDIYEQRFTAGPWIARTRALYDAVLAGSQWH